MFFHLKPLLLSLVLLLGYELMAYNYGISSWVTLILLASVIFGTIKITESWKISSLPLLFFIGSTLLLFFVNRGLFLHVYIILTSAACYLIMLGIYRLSNYKKDETARRIIFLASLFSIFIWFASLWANYINQNISFWLISLILYLVTSLITYQLLNKILLKKKTNYWLYSFGLAYGMLVINLGLFFLPFGYLTLGMLALAAYYILATYIIQSESGSFSRLSIALDIAVFILAAFIVLVSSRWDLLV